MRLCSEFYSKALRGRIEVAQMLSENAQLGMPQATDQAESERRC